MKSIYSGFVKRTPDELKKIWDEGLITFDANVLLNLYRYSTSTSQEILKIIEKFSSKIFLTHQAGLEFHRNRFEVITEQEKAYKEFTENIKKIEDELNSKSKHPFLSDSLHEKLKSVLIEVKNETQTNEKYYCDLILDDDIYEKLNEIFSEKIESEFSNEQLAKIYDEGKIRYEKKIPPGFEDEKDKEGNKIFGDLILWKQIIENAKSNGKPIILITEERKKDWWWKLKNNKTIGPRQELIAEIKKEANVEFYLYSTERFVEYGLSYLQEASNPKVIEEVKEFREVEDFKNIELEKELKKELLKKYNILLTNRNIINEDEEIDFKKRIRFLEFKRDKIFEEILLLKENPIKDEELSNKYVEMRNSLEEIQNEIYRLNKLRKRN
jgi:hypothetical protein